MAPDGIERREDVRRSDRNVGGHEQDPGRSLQTVEWRDLLSTTLDKGRAAGQEERDIRPEAGGDSEPCVVVQFGAPGFKCAVDGRGGIGGSAGQPSSHRDPLFETSGQRRCGTRASGPAATDRRTGRGERAKDEVVGGWSGIETRNVERVAMASDRSEA